MTCPDCGHEWPGIERRERCPGCGLAVDELETAADFLEGLEAAAELERGWKERG